MPTILLAENDLEQAKLYSLSLQKTGFQVIHVTNASELEKIINKQKIDIILSDTELDESNGDEICKKLLEEEKLNDVLIIGMSNALDYGDYWISIAHEFLYKRAISEFYDLGCFVRALYERFKINHKIIRYKENLLRNRFQ